MQIELKRGHASNITPIEKPQGAVECNLENGRVLLNRDLADKVNVGDDILVAGKLHDSGLFHAVAIKNLSQNKTAQIDGTNYILALGVSGFIAIVCAVQAINYISWGFPTIASGLAFAALVGLIGIPFTTLRIIEISRATRQVKYTSP
jgi:hypothetical protein